MIPAKELPHQTEVDFPLSPRAIAALQRHAEQLHQTAKDLHEQSTREEGFVRGLRDNMSGEIAETADIYNSILRELDLGGKLTIRATQKEPQLRRTFWNDEMYRGRIAEAPFPTDFELEIKRARGGADIYRGESIVVEDLISTVFQEDPITYGSVRDALRSGLTVNLASIVFPLNLSKKSS